MSDAVLQDLIVRLASDEGFAGSLRAQPTILDGFDLTADERAMLLGLGADSGSGASGLAERQSKSSLLFMGQGHHVEGHVNLGHTPGLASPGPIHHDFASVNPGPQQHDSGPAHFDAKVHAGGLDAGGKEGHQLIGADKWHAGEAINHDAKIHDTLGAGGKEWHGPAQLDAKIHQGGLSGNLGADKFVEGGFTGGVKVDVTLNGDG